MLVIFTDQTAQKVKFIVRDRGIGPYRTCIGLASYSQAPCDKLVLFDPPTQADKSACYQPFVRLAHSCAG